MKRLLFLLLCAPFAHAGYSDSVVEAGWAQGFLPPIVSVSAVTPTSDTEGTATVTTNYAARAGRDIFALVTSCSSTLDAAQVIQSSSAITSQTEALTLTGLSPGTEQCLYVTQKANGKRSVVAVSAPFTPAGSSTDVLVSWNPGIYLGIKYSQYEAAGWEAGNPSTVAAAVASVWANNNTNAATMCTPEGDQYYQGSRIKFPWGYGEPRPPVNGVPQYDWSLIDGILAHHRTCGAKAKRLMITLSAKALNAEADRDLAIINGGPGVGISAPPDLVSQSVYWEKDGKRKTTRRSAASYWNVGEVQDRFRAFILAFAERYKDEHLIEYVAAKGEGAFAVPNQDHNGAPSNFTYDKALTFLTNVGDEFRAIAPKIPFLLGTNNYRAGAVPTNFETYALPWLATNPVGKGIRWPDSFWPKRKQKPPFTSHHHYYPFLSGKVMMMGELQIPGNRFQDWNEIYGATLHKQAVLDQPVPDEELSAPNDRGWFGFTGNPPNQGWHTSHVVCITTFASFRCNDLKDIYKAGIAAGHELYDACPTRWDGRCVTGRE